ncbi:hypothetical protein GCM10009828_020570 [Actinoplanes couchii]|uniref:Uncharacterized protein n=1 Tax=Actinoplanes couchii TaxID=403638 RepID=A0ABQ3XHW6_9ACTN|nr:hypothetical protein Aco03nite_064090 [Actinoplanes couchii]
MNRSDGTDIHRFPVPQWMVAACAEARAIDRLRRIAGHFGWLPGLRAALLPAAPAEPVFADPAGLLAEERIRVRCGGGWHLVAVRGGRLELLDHTGAAPDPAAGCLRARQAWEGGDGRVPKGLRFYRRDLFQQLNHDPPAVAVPVHHRPGRRRGTSRRTGAPIPRRRRTVGRPGPQAGDRLPPERLIHSRMLRRGEVVAQRSTRPG